MSFDIHISCNCYQDGKMDFPDFKDKLEFVEGIWYLKHEYEWTDYEKHYDNWKFCEHNQYAYLGSKAQSIIYWRKYLEENYSTRFQNLILFFPNDNSYANFDYNKEKVLLELKEFIKLQNEEKYITRLKQFEEMLKIAIEFNQTIYWN
ncbi:hypothetical protein [Aureivirga sp. CE67]|uniref:hypothetical protein n=1 Tax=Aureivirga sp. CE67 TaxID=1788983 RepID=UPI0018C92824|nr:hypothetical protein [Aureivirga sp. CE67]